MNANRLIAIIVLSLVFTTTQAQTTLDTYALSGVTLIDANHIAGLAHQTVVIRKGRIEDIFGGNRQHQLCLPGHKGGEDI
jgi:hypothetical protein